MPKPLFLIMCGLPYSGKTHLAKKISERKNYAYVGFDKLWQELASQEKSMIAADMVSEAAHLAIVRSIKSGQSAIYDTMHCTRSWRNQSVKFGNSLGAHSVIVHLATPVETILQRYHSNSTNPSRHQIPIHKLEAESAKFEPPASPEYFVAFTPQTDFESWITTTPFRS